MQAALRICFYKLVYEHPENQSCVQPLWKGFRMGTFFLWQSMKISTSMKNGETKLPQTCRESIYFFNQCEKCYINYL